MSENQEIQNDFAVRKTKLEQQLDHLERFVTDLTSHKLSLENANRQLEQLSAQESDGVKRAKYYAAIRTNIELLTRIFNSISEIENIKYRYHKEIDDIMVNKFRIIDIEIRKINDKINSGEGNLTEFFEKLGNAMSSSNKAQAGAISANLDSNPDYKL